MKKITSYRLEEKVINALDLLSKGESKAKFIEVLIFREAMYKLSVKELEELYGEDFERLMLMYAVFKK